MTNYTKAAKELIAEQSVNWQMASKNYNDLKKVVVKEFSFDNFTIKVQFNPGRIRSSAAKVDKKTLTERPCFLCKKNRPQEQNEISILEKYDILINPFPIFPQHLTIVEKSHVLQLIDGRIIEMLELSKELEGFTLFYNGPKCGASAPDHFHFQAGNSGFMPIDEEMPKIIEQFGKKLINSDCSLWAVDDSIRKMLVFSSTNKESIEKEFNKVYKLLNNKTEGTEEPPMNIHSSYKAGKWQLILFLRGAHRPWQYFEEGEKNILITPASVEFGGTLITPLEKDFKKLTKEDITSIYSQVSIKKEDFEEIIQQITIDN